MKVRVQLKDGTISDIPNVSWNDRFNRLFVEHDAVIAHFKKVNDLRRGMQIQERNLDTVIGEIEFAEAPFYIQTGMRPDIQSAVYVPYGESREFWDRV